MFFIWGTGTKNRELNFDQLVVCKCCGRYGHIKVIEVYSYFSFFFIPLIKWGKRYFVQMTCCGSSCEIPKELGKDIKAGRVTALNENELYFGQRTGNVRTCQGCGWQTTENFQYCPKCGRPL